MDTNAVRKKVVLDTNVFIKACNTDDKQLANASSSALAHLFIACDVIVPDIVMYELEKHLKSPGKSTSVALLGQLVGALKTCRMHKPDMPNTPAKIAELRSIQLERAHTLDTKYAEIAHIVERPNPPSLTFTSDGLSKYFCRDFLISLVADRSKADVIISHDSDMAQFVGKKGFRPVYDGRTLNKDLQVLHPGSFIADLNSIEQNPSLKKNDTSNVGVLLRNIVEDRLNIPITRENWPMQDFIKNNPVGDDTLGLASVIRRESVKTILREARLSETDKDALEAFYSNIPQMSDRGNNSSIPHVVEIGDLRISAPTAYNGKWMLKYKAQDFPLEDYILRSSIHGYLKDTRAVPSLDTPPEYKENKKANRLTPSENLMLEIRELRDRNPEEADEEIGAAITGLSEGKPCSVQGIDIAPVISSDGSIVDFKAKICGKAYIIPVESMEKILEDNWGRSGHAEVIDI